jgi:AraC family transcriptional regulator
VFEGDEGSRRGSLHEWPGTPGIHTGRFVASAGVHHNSEFPLILVGVHAGAPVDMLQERHGTHRHRRFVFGDAFIVPAQTELLCEHAMPSDDIYLGVDPALLEQQAAELGEDFREQQALADFGAQDATLQHIAFALLAERSSADVASTLYTQALTDQLLVYLLRRYVVQVGRRLPTVEAPGSISPRRLRLTLDYIHDNLPSELSLREIAAVAGLSTQQFGRLFKQATGVTPYRYVLNARLELARTMLLRTSMTVAEVAVHAGFYDQSHLSRHFRRRYGVTPAALRAR